MKCPKCQCDNRERAKFCLECGEKLEIDCPQCGKSFPLTAKFCDECGKKLAEVVVAEKVVPASEGERKHITVLFSDLSGYTAMSERLDPEEVKDITSRIFADISQIIGKFDGFVEKFIGDAVMALFGVPVAHEDDPVRAIRAAKKIHELVEGMSPELEGKIGRSLSMHTGINTGLVVTGEVNVEKGTHGVAGDPLNLASRLSSVAREGEILVGLQTYRRTEGYFEFEKLKPIEVKGKVEPIQVYKVLSLKERPDKLHRLSGFRADLIGRKAEMALLAEAVNKLRDGKGSIISICGAVGTGKSRLVEEFKATFDLEEIQWLEGHAYAYAQNIPYFPMVDLLNRAFDIREGDPPEKVREKIESKTEQLVGKKEDVAPYLGSLYSLAYAEADNISPEALKSRLQDSLQSIISGLAQRTPTVFLLEDLHWADPSFVELLRRCLLEIRTPAIVLCAYRPPFSLFTSHQFTGIGRLYHEISLQDLSLSEAQDMLESLLKSDAIPYDLKTFVQDKSEGNPFYLEELVNSLIDSNALIYDSDAWKLTKFFSELDISSTINGVISSRLDRLENEAKRILQEASVIGRAFLFEILRRVTDFKKDIDGSIRGLEQLDLIRTRSIYPDLEYIFKHALTQEVVYTGLLKKDRRTIHEKIGLVMEEIFQDRIPEFYEILSFHFKKSESIHKAVDYLSKSGEKSFRKSAIEESHQYFKEAFDILTEKSIKTEKEEHLLIDLLIKWAHAFNWDSNFQKVVDLFSTHIRIAESLNDKEQLGMFYACLGYSMSQTGKPKDAYQYLTKALKLCEEVGNQKYVGFSCAWLAGTCSYLGLLDEAAEFGKRAQEISMQLEWDPTLFAETFAWSFIAHWNRGELKETEKIADVFLDKGRRYSDLRLTSFGYYVLAMARFSSGEFPSAIGLSHRAIKITKDPALSYVSKIFLGYSYLSNDQLQEAENTFEELMNESEGLGGWMYMKKITQGILGLILIFKGDLAKGMKIVNEIKRFSLESEYNSIYAETEYMIGKIYLQMVQSEGPKRLSLIAKNIGFLVKNVPFSSKKAEDHFNKAIEVSKEIGAKLVLGRVYLDLGFLHKAKNRTSPARECISKAVELFEECHADVYLKQAKEALETSPK